MDLSVVAGAAGLLFQFDTLLVVLIVAVFGLFVGAIPGLTATMAVALLVPITFFMPPVPSIVAMVTVSAMAIFAGDIPGTLLRIPGTPASAAYTNEAYAMTRKGQAELALGTALTASALGGLVGAVVLMFSAPALAHFALNFSSMEYFWLACLGLTCAVFVSHGSPIKGLVSLFLGLFLGTVGLDPVQGQLRFTFGRYELIGGLGLVPVLIGMFAVSEILRSVSQVGPPLVIDQRPVGNVFRGIGGVLWKYRAGVSRGAGLGTFVGALPGVGADIAAWISYALSRRFSKEREKFGTGHVEGVASATAANNASLSSAYVPAVVFGIPGDSLTAIVIGVLYMKGMNPGPTVFLHQPELIYAVFLSFFLANLLLLPLGFGAIKVAKRVLTVPRGILMPIILLFCIVGSYAIENLMFAVLVMLILGIVAFFMEDNGIPIAPAILGLVLGRLIEENFLTTLMKVDGDYLALFSRPIAGTLGVICVLIWVSPILLWIWRRTSKRSAAAF